MYPKLKAIVTPIRHKQTKTGISEVIDENRMKRTPPIVEIRNASEKPLTTFAYLMTTPEIVNAIRSENAKQRLF